MAVREGPRRAGDPPALVADASKAKEILGWQPEYAELDAIVDTALRWHLHRSDGLSAQKRHGSKRTIIK